MYRIATITLLSLTFLLAQSTVANTLVVSGSVIDSLGNPVAGVLVALDVRISPTGPSFYYNTLTTDAQGLFLEEVPLDSNLPSSGLVMLAMYDCDSTAQMVSLPYGPNNLDVMHHFTWCAQLLPMCSLQIDVDTLQGGQALFLTAVPSGAPPFTYLWNNFASVGPTFIADHSGTYCVSAYDANGCTATACVTVSLPITPCNVLIVVDTASSNTPLLVAQPDGAAPFTYLWSTGATTASIPLQPDPASPKWCVTVTDANGCKAVDCISIPQPTTCSVQIVETNTGSLVALTSGSMPAYLYWNTGDTTTAITPASPGSYCVTIVTVDSCIAFTCYYYSNDCFATIVEDSLSPTPNGWHLTAYASGAPPFTYYWNNANAGGPSITVTVPGTYCVKVVDALGCSATDCITVGPFPCSVKIVETTLPNASTPVLLAVVPANAYFYHWSTGDSTPYIKPSGPGNYCVTVTHSSGCTASDCFEFDPMFGHFNVKGFVTAGDPGNNLQPQGTVYLYQIDGSTAGLSLFAQTPLLPNPTLPPAPGPHAWYDFGDVPAGKYLALALLAPNTPGSDLYLPTYFGDVTSWTDAKIIAVPHGGELFNIHLVKGDSLSGPGTIDGLLVQGPGIDHAHGSERGDGVAGATVLLYDAAGLPLQYRITATDGTFSFSGLPWGTYELRIDLPGIPATSTWVIIGPGTENAYLKFTLTPEGITATRSSHASAKALLAWPNPTRQTLYLHPPADFGGQAVLIVFSSTGQPILRQTLYLVAGQQPVSIDLGILPTGLYTALLQHAKGTAVARFAIARP